MTLSLERMELERDVKLSEIGPMELGINGKHLVALALGAVLWMSAPDLVSFSGKIYQWVDESGNGGFTDDLKNIPEKYQKTAVLEESEVPASRQEGGSSEQQELPPPSTAPDTDDAGHDRAYWQGRLKELRDQRADLLERKVEIVQELEALNGRLENGIDTAKYLKLRKQYLEEHAQTKDEIKEIDHQIEDVLPEEARRSNAPPGWLR